MWISRALLLCAALLIFLGAGTVWVALSRPASAYLAPGGATLLGGFVVAGLAYGLELLGEIRDRLPRQ